MASGSRVAHRTHASKIASGSMLFTLAATLFWIVPKDGLAAASGALVAKDPGPSSPNSLDLEITQSGQAGSYTGTAHADAGSNIQFTFDSSTDELTLNSMSIRAKNTLIDFGDFVFPALTNLLVELDENSVDYPPQGTVNPTTHAVSLDIPFVVTASFLGFPLTAAETLSFTGTFESLGGGMYKLAGTPSFQFTSGSYTIDGDLALDFRKYRFPLVDLNGDGAADPAVRASGSASWSASYVPGQTDLSVSFGNSGDTPLVGDFNGDGISDLVSYQPASSSTWIISYSPDFSGTDLSITFGSSTTSDKPFVCDFNGDGLTDIGVTRTGFLGSATYLIRFSPTWGSGTEVTKSFGLASDSKFFGDVDGDAACDIIVNRSGNQNYVTYSPDWGTGTDLSKGFGLSGDVPVHADFDGDGLIDFAVMRDTGTSLLWYATYSSGGYSGTQISTTLGSTGGFPVVDDYNGDGKADIGVYQSNQFVIQFSPDFIGTDRTESLGANGDYKLQRPTSSGGSVGR